MHEMQACILNVTRKIKKTKQERSRNLNSAPSARVKRFLFLKSNIATTPFGGFIAIFRVGVLVY